MGWVAPGCRTIVEAPHRPRKKIGPSPSAGRSAEVGVVLELTGRTIVGAAELRGLPRRARPRSAAAGTANDRGLPGACRPGCRRSGLLHGIAGDRSPEGKLGRPR